MSPRVTAIGHLILLALAFAAPVIASDGPDSPVRPNIVLILADDMGWRDVSYHDSEIQTPSIDRIARVCPTV